MVFFQKARRIFKLICLYHRKQKKNAPGQGSLSSEMCLTASENVPEGENPSEEIYLLVYALTYLLT